METTQKASIPREIVLHIFSYLPVKSLMRFKGVSRFCSSLVSDPYFIENHQNHFIHRPDKTKFLALSHFIHRPNKTKFLAFSSLGQTPEPCEFRVGKLNRYTKIAYAKGLLCLWEASLIYRVIILNPSTRETRILPCMQSLVDHEELNDLNRGTCRYSLGFDPDKKRHKVLMTHTYQNKVRNWVFTLGTPDESWREIKSSTIPYVKSYLLEGVHIDGIVYFFGHKNINPPSVIVAFNVRTEEFRIISTFWDGNSSLIDYFIRYQLVAVKGKLAVIDYEIQPTIWILQNSDDQEWVHQELALEEEEEFCINGENMVLVNWFIKQNFIFLFDLKKHWWRAIEILGPARKEETLQNNAYIATNNFVAKYENFRG